MRDNALQWASVPPADLDIAASLTSGQAFRWVLTPTGDWVGAIRTTAVLLRPAPTGFWWQTAPEPGRWDVVSRYFALDVPLASLYSLWLTRDARIAPAIERWRGLRILRQDAVEALVCFACACCNTVVKIARSVTALANRYGEELGQVQGQPVRAFPTLDRLAEADESALRRDLWGFRAPRVIQLARDAIERGPGWVEGLRRAPYPEARAALEGLPGVGPKIADCVCLFGLWFDEACPVDTHVRQVAERWFGRSGGARSLTPRAYDSVANRLRAVFGDHVGWAQQYVFMDELARRPRPPATAA